MNTGSYKFVTKEQTSFTELFEHQEAIILDLENLHYYTLNAAASFLWKQLRTGTAQTAEELGAALSSAFRINVELAELDTRAFLDELARYGLISHAALGAKVLRTANVTIGPLPGYQPPELKVSHSLSHVTLSGSGGFTPPG